MWGRAKHRFSISAHIPQKNMQHTFAPQFFVIIEKFLSGEPRFARRSFQSADLQG